MNKATKEGHSGVQLAIWPGVRSQHNYPDGGLWSMTFNETYFRRYDETDDGEFYQSPRLVVHIDEPAIVATTALFRDKLPEGGAILDLMSSWRSHLPTDVVYGRVAGLGMNAVELKQNPQLTDYVVQNLNQSPMLPYPDGAFDGCVVTVSVQYLTQPVAIFREVARVLKPGAPSITVFSNRMFPTKAVAVWQSLGDAGHAQLVETYYRETGLFMDVHTEDHSPNPRRSDPVFATIGLRRGTSAGNARYSEK